jgi:hypothetical protein
MFLDCFLKHFGSLRQGQEMEKNGSTAWRCKFSSGL